jgi:hypothetical protein
MYDYQLSQQQLYDHQQQPQLLQTCCRVGLLRSGGPAATLQANRLGVYRISGLVNGKPVYKHVRNRGNATQKTGEQRKRHERG